MADASSMPKQKSDIGASDLHYPPPFHKNTVIAGSDISLLTLHPNAPWPTSEVTMLIVAGGTVTLTDASGNDCTFTLVANVPLTKRGQFKTFKNTGTTAAAILMCAWNNR